MRYKTTTKSFAPTDSVLGPGKIIWLVTTDDRDWTVDDVKGTKSIEAYHENDGSLWFRVFLNDATGRSMVRVNGLHVTAVGYPSAPAGEAD